MRGPATLSRSQSLPQPGAALPLSEASLGNLPPAIMRPRYDRRSLRPGIVHIGLGNFHRAHQGWYLHRLMQEGRAMDWAVLGAGVRPGDAAMRAKLLSQDCLTTLIELGPKGVSGEVSGSLAGYIPVEADNRPLVAAMAAPSVRIVSLTVTEGGYFRDPASGALDTGHPDILHDAEFPARPRTAFGAILAALKIRRDAGHGAFTVQSCDNLAGNGDVLGRMLLSLARLSDPGLADWIGGAATFPNSMVDCIVPATGEAELARARAMGVQDAVPVTHENFRQWVIEDRFCAGRPDWERVGVTFSDRVHDFETMKIRILNAGHQVLANAGEILGLETIAACMDDPALSAFFYKVQTREILPHVGAVPGMSALDYLGTVGRRFANPAIGDTTRRVAFDGSARHGGFVVPVLRDAAVSGAPLSGLALTQALWAGMCTGYREDGRPIAANDPSWDSLVARATAARENPLIWLGQGRVYGDLAGHARFRDSFAGWMEKIAGHGVRAALAAYLEGAEDPDC